MSLRRPRGMGLMGLIGLLVLFVVTAAVLAGPSMVADWLKSMNPFAEETVDRTGPSVLQALNNISDYHPASTDGG